MSPLSYSTSLVRFGLRSLSALVAVLNFAASVMSAPPPAPGWTIVTSPNTSPTQHNAFFDLTCVSASQCWSVGSHNNAGGYHQTMIAQWTAPLGQLFRRPAP